MKSSVTKYNLEDKKITCLSVRDFTHKLAAVLFEGGEVVVYKGSEPYRYLNIRPVEIRRGGILNEEYEERKKESELEGKEKLLIGERNG